MPSKRRREQLKNAQLVTAKQAKKRKVEVDTALQPGINDQLCNVDISNTSDTDDSEQANGFGILAPTNSALTRRKSHTPAPARCLAAQRRIALNVVFFKH